MKLDRVHRIVSCVFLLALTSTGANAQDGQEKLFSGLNLALDLGIQDSPFEDEGTDVFVGLFAGYRQQFDNNVTVGIEGGGASASGLDGFWDVVGSVGYVAGEKRNHHFYLNAGYLDAGQFLGQDSNGLLVSIGYEAAISKHWGLRAQASFADLSRRAGDPEVITNGSFTFTRTHPEVDNMLLFSLGLTYRF